ncbi:MAG: HNH endonuclease [Candidatus Wallbacteria bacterium]|nr:HNH endonuclease [Candidatus Wallbacteria bacterium]
MNQTDYKIRIAAFKWVEEQTAIHGEVLRSSVIKNGFTYGGETIYLMSQRGIFKPRQMELPLTITTSPNNPYSDDFDGGSLLRYSYFGTDPLHPDNVGLRKCMQFKIPLIYFHAIEKGVYTVFHPVFIAGDDPQNLSFTVAVNDFLMHMNNQYRDDEQELSQDYKTALAKVRIHQQKFRYRVLQAYQTRCSLCRLKHEELLDAAHIIPDSDPACTYEINNGLSLCKLHHAAFDKFLLAITPDYRIKIREDILDENDGPLLQHGLKNMNNSTIILPHNNSQKPKREYLEQRYELFKKSQSSRQLLRT